MDIKTLTCRKYDKMVFYILVNNGTVQQNLVSEIIKIKILLEGLNKKPEVYKCVLKTLGKGFDSNRIPATILFNRLL